MLFLPRAYCKKANGQSIYGRSMLRGYKGTEVPSVRPVSGLMGGRAEAFCRWRRKYGGLRGANTGRPGLPMAVGSSVLINYVDSIWACLSCGACRNR